MLLRDERLDPSQENNVALTIAANDYLVDVVELLIENLKVDFSKLTNRILNLALNHQRITLILSLTRNGVDLSENAVRFLKYAVQNN